MSESIESESIEANLRDQINRLLGDRAEEAIEALDLGLHYEVIRLTRLELRNWVAEFEVAGLAAEHAGDEATGPKTAVTWFELAMRDYEDGMYYATGSGEGWAFRRLHDRTAQKLRSARARANFSQG